MGLIFVLIWGCFRSYVRAKLTNLNPTFWVMMTAVSVIIAWFLGAVIVVSMMLMQDPLLREMLTAQQPDQDAVVKYLSGKNLIVSEIFIFVAALGGYLFIRYLMTRKGDLPKEETDS